MERGDFVALPYTAKLRRSSDKVQVQLRRDGNAWGVPISITKAVTLAAGEDKLQVTYLLEGLPPGRPFHFASEWNFAGMPSEPTIDSSSMKAETHLGSSGIAFS